LLHFFGINRNKKLCITNILVSAYSTIWHTTRSCHPRV
jgi:hypothetical protein